ncbi:hypothetical protein GCM10023194_36900 [Planotetraspora phitsanulokensis]|uniref:Uncharacterized protein n=1 Tax=Planotetraspora phitsanulokensis TaxID=575192 RepID=A0A8J3XH49_9ACTN|nr:hypothetical protein [Planotetraspora phitsanulokensis]GII36183.1 hypothetical protein Pph01_11860 [Planotetraspora phitsanulokensis]
MSGKAEVTEEATAYWHRRLSPLPQETTLPADFPYRLEDTGERETRELALDADPGMPLSHALTVNALTEDAPAVPS